MGSKTTGWEGRGARRSPSPPLRCEEHQRALTGLSSAPLWQPQETKELLAPPSPLLAPNLGEARVGWAGRGDVEKFPGKTMGLLKAVHSPSPHSRPPQSLSLPGFLVLGLAHHPLPESWAKDS